MVIRLSMTKAYLASSPTWSGSQPSLTLPIRHMGIVQRWE